MSLILIFLSSTSSSRKPKDELAELGAVARRMNLRLSLHPSQYIVLNAADEEIARKSIADLVAQADILDGMGLDDNAVVITHVGGVYGDKATSMQRWVERYKALPEHARARLISGKRRCLLHRPRGALDP